MISGWDLATRRIGAVYGDGSAMPQGVPILLPQVGDDIGLMLSLFHDQLKTFHRLRPSTVWIVEAPIIPTHGKKGDQKAAFGSVMQRRKQLAISGHLAFFAHVNDIAYREESVFACKRELAGSSHAAKDDMVAVALRVGLELPKTEDGGRKDVADAFAPWLIGVRLFAKQYTRAWDTRIWTNRGGLI